MDVFEVPFALLTFLGLVAIAPVWFWFVDNFQTVDQLSPESTFLVNIMFPLLVLLFLGSWLEGGPA